MVLKKGLKLVNVLLLSSLLFSLLFFLIFYGSGTITGAVISLLPDAESTCAGNDCAELSENITDVAIIPPPEKSCIGNDCTGLSENITDVTILPPPEELKPEPAIIEQNQTVIEEVTLENSTESEVIVPQTARSEYKASAF